MSQVVLRSELNLYSGTAPSLTRQVEITEANSYHALENRTAKQNHRLANEAKTIQGQLCFI